jgi:uncharacterized protein HemY
MGWAEAPAQTLSRAEELANKALNLDESDVTAHIVLGRIHVFHQQYQQAKAEMERAAALRDRQIPTQMRAVDDCGDDLPRFFGPRLA